MIALMVSSVLMASDVDPQLLKRLAEHDERMEKYIDAHVMNIEAEAHELGDDGKLLHTYATRSKQRRVSGKLQTTVLSSTKDGEDQTQDEQERASKRDAQDKRSESPFATRNQGKYRFKSLGPPAQGSPQLLIGFEPKSEPSPEVMEGVAVVDPEAGEVVQFKMKPSKLQMLVDSASLELRYDNKTETGRNVSWFKGAGGGGLPLMKRRGDLIMKFTFE
jgi:hypothetical protein